MSLRLKLALRGDLAAFAKVETRRLETAVTAEVSAAGGRLKERLRGQVTGAGLGSRLARTWRNRSYPEPRKGDPSMDAAAFVFSKAPEVISGHEGAVIRARRSTYLAIATDSAPKRGTDGRRITPRTFPEGRFGPLRFVPRRGRHALLVVDGLRQSRGKRGGFRKAGKRATAKGETATVVMFVLVPQVSLRRRLERDGPAKAELSVMTNRIAQRLVRRG